MLTAALLFVAVASSADGGSAEEDAPVVDRRSRELMATRVTVALVKTGDPSARDEAFAEAFAVFERIERDMNEWRPESSLGRINAGAGGPPVPASKEVCEVIALALEGAERTGGLFDPTWAALRAVWRFNPEQTGAPPDEADLQRACRNVSHRLVQVRPAPHPTPEAWCVVRLARKGVQLGLGGLVKGWGVDQAVRGLRARGYRDFFVQAGGDLYLAGKNGDRPWRVGIRDPRGPESSTFARAEVSDAAFSTSGDYEHFFIYEGRRYHHIIDPRTCQPATASVSATVLAKSAVDAELLTKAAFILGPGDAEKLAEKLASSIVLVDPRGNVHMSAGLRGKVEQWPTSFVIPAQRQ